MEMTADVRAAIDLLLDSGFETTETKTGGMASGLVRLLGSGIEVTVSRDRGQWMLSFLIDGHHLDLDAVVASRTGKEDWSLASHEQMVPAQLPEGVHWRTELPVCLSRRAHTPDAVDRVEGTKQRRTKALFG